MNKYILLIATIILLAACIMPLYAATYQAVPTNATKGFAEVYSATQGVEYGTARIDYSYWNSGDLWYYSYQIFNNDYYNTPTNQADDYHFGWMYMGQSSNASVFDTINKFSINFGSAGSTSNPDIQVLDTQAGSTAGGGSWGHAIDPNNDGIDWTVSLGTGTPLAIDPARGTVSRKGVWTMSSSGNSSRSDSNGQYFQIVSTWAPAFRTAAITAGVDKEASGLVIAPGVAPAAPIVPEPGSFVALVSACGVFGLGILRRKPRKR